jgi:transposase
MLCFGPEVFMADKRRQFTREFKLEAVRLVTEEKRPASEVARHLGIRADMLRCWRRQLEGRAGLPAAEAFPGHGRAPSADEEVRRLRREVERLRQERDFLKKAAAYFAKG